MKNIYIIVFSCLTFAAFGQGFLHRNGQQIVNGNGENILLRGLGLGGWMVQEGYMLQTESFAGPQHKIREKITALIGATSTEEFYQLYRENGITKRDIDSLKAWGFNSVRLPMHYNLYTLPIEQEPVAGENTWLEEGFTMTDNLLNWCEANQMYLILDLHAAPGGQGKDAAISDYDATKPSLWESTANQNKMIAFWQKIALRYKDKQWIGAYDIINEPNWAFTGTNINGCDETSNAPLRALMVSITQAIRAVDTNHMIIIEGNCWGNNYNGILNNGLWDQNMALSFHKYWNNNGIGSIQGMLNYRTQLNVPIWLGESGENSNVWFTDAISLMETNNIGWAFWPMKKIESIAGVAAVTKNPDYEQVLNYWKNGGTAPTAEFAKNALLQLANNYKIQNVTTKPDVVDAMFRQVQTNETKKYKNHPLPGKVFATEYDLGKNGHAYFDKDIANYRVDTNIFTDWNKGWAMRNDGVDIQACTDNLTNGFQVGFIDNDEWLLYTLDVNSDTAFDIDFRYASTGTSKIYLEDANGRISESISLASTGGFNTWQTLTLNDVILKQGANKIKVYFEIGLLNLNYLDFKNPRATNTIALKVVDASTGILGDKINVTFNKNLQTGINFSSSNLQLKVNGNNVAISSVTYKPGSANSLVLKPATAVNQNDVITLTYNGSNIIAADGTTQPVFTNKPVKNNTGNILGVSGKIEAENFFFNSGLSIESTQDLGGGQNIGYTDAGDYLEYLVDISQTGNYKIEYRHSGESATGQIKLQLLNDTTQDIHTVLLPSTGNWQSWATKSVQNTLPQGRYIARITVIDSGFNLNWIKFSYVDPDDDNDNVSNLFDNCPNTPSGDVVDFNGCTLFSLAANNFTVLATSESCRNSNNGSIAIQSATSHPFLATLTATTSQSKNFTTATLFDGLQAGTYTLCISIPTIPTFKSCSEVVITQPKDLAVQSRLIEQSAKLHLDLKGSTFYKIEVNTSNYTTSQNFIELDLEPGINNVSVSTDKECQGIYKQRFTISSGSSAYPNPVSDLLHLNLPVKKNEAISLQVYSMLGKVMIEKTLYPQTNSFDLDVSSLAAGTYLIKAVSGSSTHNLKILKQ